jgi:hypothetical protein
VAVEAMSRQASPSTHQPYGIARVLRVWELPRCLRLLKGVRTSMRRVLRLMREAEFPAPARQPEPIVEHPHAGTIVTDRPNVMCGTDATAAVTLLEGTATIFAAIDHCTSV